MGVMMVKKKRGCKWGAWEEEREEKNYVKVF